MAYSRGTSTNIIVGAAALFVADTTLTPGTLETAVSNESFRETLADDATYTNVGYTMNGLELQFQPDFGEVRVDQILDVAKLYKQGMQVNLATAFAEATLENLLLSLETRHHQQEDHLIFLQVNLANAQLSVVLLQ